MNKASLVNEAQIIGAQPGSAERSRVELLVIPVPVSDRRAGADEFADRAGPDVRLTRGRWQDAVDGRG